MLLAYHEWVEMATSVFALVGQGSVHVHMEAVRSLGQSANVARDEDGAPRAVLLQVQGATHATVRALHQIHLGQDGSGLGHGVGGQGVPLSRAPVLVIVVGTGWIHVRRPLRRIKPKGHGGHHGQG